MENMAQDYKPKSELVKNLVVTGGANLSSSAIGGLSEQYVAANTFFQGPWTFDVYEPLTFTRSGKQVCVTLPFAIANANGPANSIVGVTLPLALPDAGWLPAGNGYSTASVPIVIGGNANVGTLFHLWVPGDRANNVVYVETGSGAFPNTLGNSGVLQTSYSYTTV